MSPYFAKPVTTLCFLAPPLCPLPLVPGNSGDLAYRVQIVADIFPLPLLSPGFATYRYTPPLRRAPSYSKSSAQLFVVILTENKASDCDAAAAAFTALTMRGDAMRLAVCVEIPSSVLIQRDMPQTHRDDPRQPALFPNPFSSSRSFPNQALYYVIYHLRIYSHLILNPLPSHHRAITPSHSHPHKLYHSITLSLTITHTTTLSHSLPPSHSSLFPHISLMCHNPLELLQIDRLD